MASVTLAESAKLARDDLVAGVIEEIIDVNQIFTIFPFDGITGNALAYNRENALGGVGVAGVGTAIASSNLNPITGETATPKAAATFDLITSGLTTILGDAEINGMIQATRSSDGNDQTAVQIASKAKHCGRVYQWMMINGTGSSDQFTGLITLCDSGQTLTEGTNGNILSLERMDEMADMVTAKDGQVDYYMMSARDRRAYRTLLRSLGGAAIMETIELPSGKNIMAYGDIPVFRNDYIPITGTVGGSTDVSYMFAGTLDDGSRSNGLTGITAEQAAGIIVEDVGIAEAADDHIWRVKWYCGMALFSLKSLAMANVTPSGA